MQSTAILEKQTRPNNFCFILLYSKLGMYRATLPESDMSQGLEGLMQALQELVEDSKQKNVAEYELQLFRAETSSWLHQQLKLLPDDVYTSHVASLSVLYLNNFFLAS